MYNKAIENKERMIENIREAIAEARESSPAYQRYIKRKQYMTSEIGSDNESFL